MNAPAQRTAADIRADREARDKRDAEVQARQDVAWSVAMGFETQEEYDAREDEHPGDNDPRIEDGWS